MPVNATQLMGRIASPHYDPEPRAEQFRKLIALKGSRMAAIRYGLWWIIRHKGYGRWGLRMAVRWSANS